MTKQAKDINERISLGLTLRGARANRRMTQQDVAELLTMEGLATTKAAAQHWESGRNVPDALVVKRLSKVYQQTADSLLWESGPSQDAMKLAAQFDAMSPQDQERVKAMIMIFETTAPISDAEVEAKMPATRAMRQSNKAKTKANV